MSLYDPDGMKAWDAWTGSAPEKKSVSTSSSDWPAQCGWARVGIPPMAGDGFAWNREGTQGFVPAEQAVLQLSTVWACIVLLSGVMSTLPCDVYRKKRDGTRVPADDHPLSTLLGDEPNPEMSAQEFWQIMFAWMFLRGAGYAERDSLGGRTVNIWPLFGPALTWTWLDGKRIYRYTDPATGRQRIIPNENIWRMPAFWLGGRNDMSPIAYGARMFAGALAADMASDRFFERGMSASGFVTMPDGVWLKKEQRDSLQESLDTFRGARNAGGVFTLEGGAKYQALTLKPEDAQMLETRSFNVEEICRWYGVPPVLIGHGDKTSNWGTGLEQQDLTFLKYSLRQWIKRAEGSAKRSLFTPGEKKTLSIEFNLEGLLRADSKTRAEFYDTMTRAGIYTRDYCRQLENLPPMGGNAAELLVQSQNVPIDEIGADFDPRGQQLTALQSILESAGAGDMPLESARAAIAAGFPQFTPAQIDAMIAPLKNFEPPAPPPAPSFAPSPAPGVPADASATA